MALNSDSISPNGRTPNPSRPITARQSHVSHASWISSLAMGSPQPPIPVTIPTSTPSPVSTVKTLKLGQGLQESPEYENMQLTEKEVGISPTTPTSTRKSKARSFVGGFVNGLRSIPRAVTHNQLHDRKSYSVSRYSTSTDSASGMPTMVQGLHYKYPPQPLRGPLPVPFILAPPPPFGHTMHPRGNTVFSKQSSGDSSLSSRIGGFLEELNSLPWISSRVAVDYIPGESDRGRERSRSSESWYSVVAPSTPSDITDRWKFVPEPWFPPTQLPPTQEVPEEEAGEDDSLEKKLEKTREELQEKTRELSDLRQVVEHQKKHIGALEGELAELRQAAELQDQSNIHRRRSSTRKSLYRTRDSVRTVTSMRRSSVSRPPSSRSFYN